MHIYHICQVISVFHAYRNKHIKHTQYILNYLVITKASISCTHLDMFSIVPSLLHTSSASGSHQKQHLLHYGLVGGAVQKEMRSGLIHCLQSAKEGMEATPCSASCVSCHLDRPHWSCHYGYHSPGHFP